MNDDIPALLFALSSCSIEGSELAIELLELKDKVQGSGVLGGREMKGVR